MGDLASCELDLQIHQFTNSPTHQLTNSPILSIDLIIRCMHLVLASASPRRAELMTAAGLSFDVLPVDVDERPRSDEAAPDYVVRLAQDKSAQAVEILIQAKPRSNVMWTDDSFVIGADTAVVADGAILGKPRDDEDARSMLTRLSGRSHQVMTGVCVRSAKASRARLETTHVWFLP